MIFLCSCAGHDGRFAAKQQRLGVMCTRLSCCASCVLLLAHTGSWYCCYGGWNIIECLVVAPDDSVAEGTSDTQWMGCCCTKLRESTMTVNSLFRVLHSSKLKSNNQHGSRRQGNSVRTGCRPITGLSG